MGTTLSTAQQPDHRGLFSSVCLASLLVMAATLWIFYSARIKRLLKKFIRTQLRRRLLDRNIRASETDAFASYYRQSLCDLQKTNNDLLGEILLKNHSCQFFIDRSISVLSTHRPSSSKEGYLSVDEFRAKVPLTTYEDFRPYIDRIVLNGEKNVLSSEKIIYFATSSGTTGKFKMIPITKPMVKNIRICTILAYAVIYRSLPAASFPSPEQLAFNLNSGKKAASFPRSKDGTPIGALSVFFFAVSLFPGMRTIMSAMSAQPIDLLEEMTDFETSSFVQLTFALATPDLFSYIVTFAPGLVHSVKMIKAFYEEMALCIELADFEHSSLVRKTVSDAKVRMRMNRALKEVILEHGGASFQLSRAKLIREQCRDADAPALLHRLWPQLLFVSTAIGASFAIYREELEFYCGKNLPLTNMGMYGASEGFFGSLASIYTDEYFLLPTSAFFEFIREEDIHQAQPTTLLLSEIEPGHRYELVCTTGAGLVRYRMGDVITCTRLLSRAQDIVPLPADPVDVPRVPLVSIAYRVGNLLDVFGEKTTEQHVLNTLQQCVRQWNDRGLAVDLEDFTSYPNLNVSLLHYVLFVELSHGQGNAVDDESLQTLQASLDDDVEKQLCINNPIYGATRKAQKLAPLTCTLVQNGTFSTFLRTVLVTDHVSPVQVKPHRLLKTEQHIQFFHDHRYCS